MKIFLALIGAFILGFIFGYAVRGEPYVPDGWECTKSVVRPNMGTKQKQPMDVCVSMREIDQIGTKG